MEPTLDTIRGLRELTEDELRQIRGGDGGKRLLWHVLQKAADCMIDEWDRMQECFQEGMTEAKG